MSPARTISAISAAAVLALAALALLVLPVRAQDTTVSMEDIAFVPSSVTVSEGDTVTWVNNDGDIPHNVTSTDGGPLASDTFSGGGSFEFTFTEPGTYAYECTIHPDVMTGTVTVEAAVVDDDDDMVDDDDDMVEDDNDVAPDDTAPPATGTGTASGSGSGATWLLIAAVVAVLLLGGGFVGLRAARNR